MALVDLEDEDEEPLVEFLLSLTDERVREERAPFHPGDAAAVTCRNGLEACDDLLEVPPIGRRGRPAAGLDPLGTFLDLEPVE